MAVSAQSDELAHRLAGECAADGQQLGVAAQHSLRATQVLVAMGKPVGEKAPVEGVQVARRCALCKLPMAVGRVCGDVY